MDRISAEDIERDAKPAAIVANPRLSVNRSLASSVDTIFGEISGMLHLISAGVTDSIVHAFITMWKSKLATAEDTLFINSLGFVLSEIFDSSAELAKASIGRPLNLPSSDASYRADTLVHVEQSSNALIDVGESTKRIPVFVTKTESPELVIDCALSVYIRRGRMPEPGEILFCTPDTTLEELNLILMRFIFAQKHGRGNSVFCIADIHVLSYAHQCTLVENLRTMLRDYGQDSAASLLLISGLPRQVALNSMSSQMIDLPPLDAKELRKSIAEAFSSHCGETVCVASVVNGGGKSHYIQSEISQRQRERDLQYCKVPIRESTDPNKLIDLLTSVSSIGINAYHIDIGHVIPLASNTILFQLLFVGVLRDPLRSRAYFRNRDDYYYIEIPNSPNNRTAEALRFCCLLPSEILYVTADCLDFCKPSFSDSNGTIIVTPEYSEMKNVSKWLRAVKQNYLKHGHANFNGNYSPWEDADITEKECFDLLSEACCKPNGPSPAPSWAIFHSFLVFMNMQFTFVEEYDLLRTNILACMQG